MEKDDYKYMLQDSIEELIEKTSNVDTSTEYGRGMRMAYFQILDTLKNNAESFGIDPDSIGFKDFDPDSLIGFKKTA